MRILPIQKRKQLTGKIVKLFDANLWDGKDKGNNWQFWKEAKVVDHYKIKECGTTTEYVDVIFQHTGRMSKRHFASSVMLIHNHADCCNRCLYEDEHGNERCMYEIIRGVDL